MKLCLHWIISVSVTVRNKTIIGLKLCEWDVLLISSIPVRNKTIIGLKCKNENIYGLVYDS